jgi:hypothetical protein
MAKKQTRRSISVSRTTYERLKAFCEANNVSMSQLVETRVNDFLGEGSAPTTTTPTTPRPTTSVPSGQRPSMPAAPATPKQETASRPAPAPTPAAIPMTSAAARFAVDPPPPIIKQKQDTNAPKPAEKRPDQIFTF